MEFLGLALLGTLPCRCHQSLGASPTPGVGVCTDGNDFCCWVQSPCRAVCTALGQGWAPAAPSLPPREELKCVSTLPLLPEPPCPAVSCSNECCLFCSLIKSCNPSLPVSAVTATNTFNYLSLQNSLPARGARISQTTDPLNDHMLVPPCPRRLQQAGLTPHRAGAGLGWAGESLGMGQGGCRGGWCIWEWVCQTGA